MDLTLPAFLREGAESEKIVPPTGATAIITGYAACAMGILAVLALSLVLAAGKVSRDWSEDVARAASIRVAAQPAEMDRDTETVLEILRTTPGVESYRVIPAEEQAALLKPWLGGDVPLDALPLPQLVEIVERTGGSVDMRGLALRLRGEVPSAILNDQERWRGPIARASGQLRFLSVFTLLLILGITGAVVSLAAHAALASNAQVIQTLRLIGAEDGYIAKAFVNRFTRRSLIGAATGTIGALVVMILLPLGQPSSALLSGLRPSGGEWLLFLLIPVALGLVSFLATRRSARNMLQALA